jgi:hypothetical protein
MASSERSERRTRSRMRMRMLTGRSWAVTSQQQPGEARCTALDRPPECMGHPAGCGCMSAARAFVVYSVAMQSSHRSAARASGHVGQASCKVFGFVLPWRPPPHRRRLGAASAAAGAGAAVIAAAKAGRLAVPHDSEPHTIAAHVRKRLPSPGAWWGLWGDVTPKGASRDAGQPGQRRSDGIFGTPHCPPHPVLSKIRFTMLC